MVMRRCALLALACLWARGAEAKPTAPSPPPEATAPKQGDTPLDRYVAAADPSFSWKMVSRHDEGDATVLIVDLKSQTWRKAGEIDRPLWQHWMCITVPKGAQGDIALLLIGGGSNGGEAPAGPSERARTIALETKSTVVELGQVPNEPLEFRGDGKPRKEDDLVARSWVECLKTGDSTWVAQFPMTKAAVRAMDAAQAAVKEAGLPVINKFVVAGGSKRGWTTWLTAVVDPRVVAIAPVVIDVLNVQKSMKNHHAAYGFWAQSLNNYEQQSLTRLVDSPLSALLFSLVDPYAFRARLALPKCIINATGDQFFTPDSSQVYFDDLVGEKLLCYVPNADHSLEGSDALDTLIAFYWSVLHDAPRPEIAWSRRRDGGWRVSSKPPAKSASLWTATNAQARDFRVRSIGKAFTSQPLKVDAQGNISFLPPTAPKAGYTAYFAQLEFDIGAPTPLRVSTPVHIVPDTLPYADGSSAPAAAAGE
jgi:PhoPQ-activated pathogenicity-related protein